MSDIRNALFMEKFPPSSILQCRHMRSNHSLSVTLTHIHGSFLCLWYVRTADLHRQTKPVFVFFFSFFLTLSKWTGDFEVCIYIFWNLFFCHFSFTDLHDLCPATVSVCTCGLMCHCRAIYNTVMIFHRHLKLIWEAGRIWKWKGLNEE